MIQVLHFDRTWLLQFIHCWFANLNTQGTAELHVLAYEMYRVHVLGLYTFYTSKKCAMVWCWPSIPSRWDGGWDRGTPIYFSAQAFPKPSPLRSQQWSICDLSIVIHVHVYHTYIYMPVCICYRGHYVCKVYKWAIVMSERDPLLPKPHGNTSQPEEGHHGDDGSPTPPDLRYGCLGYHPRALQRFNTVFGYACHINK